MVDRASLERMYTCKRIEGSNPSLSAIRQNVCNMDVLFCIISFMTRRDIITIIVTFVGGIIIGVYLFFSGFLQTFNSEPNVQTQVEADSFSLVAEVYGGCRDTCPSFQILSDGTYRYLFTPSAGEDQIIRDGTLPRNIRKNINNYMLNNQLVIQSGEVQPAVCNSYTDGIDIKYTVVLNEQEYILDTCGTAIDIESQLWLTLVGIWDYFETSG